MDKLSTYLPGEVVIFIQYVVRELKMDEFEMIIVTFFALKILYSIVLRLKVAREIFLE